MEIKTLYRQYASHRGVIAIRAELISENVISVHDYETRQFPNNIDALGMSADPNPSYVVAVSPNAVGI